MLEGKAGSPYTKTQLAKCLCFKCGKPARYQWSACADRNLWRPVCEMCDIALNVMVVTFLHPKTWKSKVKDYATRIGVKWSPTKKEVK